MPTPRALAREQTMREIVRIGREHLGEVGPAALSLRAVARELGVVSSAVYRYVADRDALLTLLIVDAYDELGGAVETAIAGVRTRGEARFRARILAGARATREWAVAEPSRFALLYGTPVPGYRAPRDTVDPGIRVALALVGVLDEAYAAGVLASPQERLARPVRADLERQVRELGLALPTAALARAFALWSGLFGLVSFDVFDQYGAETLTDRGAFFEHQVGLLADLVGLPRAARAS
ncbi:TetR-like C-terminal domain-containing protein [Nocardioides acrostichi]|uniref:TetR/AcrR family transcriptional regulator n=1 Tax=Nocardioides acrostichi TaxID=2784339 RepID=A0A930UWD2_9ACTN|nr:TetR-like C-terminal domain-containing protein [Nocardioides acrostichi]MBF4161366.1 TetR/AcrR family transcriptional regulator [Nocardioides acrostichi]